jgi:hypothetical protein
VVGDTRYAAPYYPKELTPAHLKFPVGISRLYFLADPQVAVDFEPNPLADVPLMHCEAKRKWCYERGIVYVPIFLRERLTREQLTERLKVERSTRDAALETKDLKQALHTEEVNDEEFNRLVDEEALRRLGVIMTFQKFRGSGKLHALRRIRKDVEAEYLQKRLNGDLGNYLGHRKPALAAR